MKKGNRAAAQDAKKKDRQVKQQLRRGRNIRKYGDEEWKSDWTKFSNQLAAVGLTIKDVAGDGNCMFRAIADQMDGDPNRHDDYRQRICDYLERNEDDFAPFVEDDRTLAAHVSEMRRNATWGGHMELQAASMLLNVNFTVHQLEQPRWEIVNHMTSRNGVRTLHLSYHDGQHYASVRMLNEDIHRVGTPAPIVIRSATPTGASSSSAPKAPIDLDSEEASWQENLVLRSTTATNIYFVRAVLIETDGDTDAAIEYVIALAGDGELEEAVQREFAYEHGIFPEGGFPEDDPIPASDAIVSTPTPSTTTPPPSSSPKPTPTTTDSPSSNSKNSSTQTPLSPSHPNGPQEYTTSMDAIDPNDIAAFLCTLSEEELELFFKDQAGFFADLDEAERSTSRSGSSGAKAKSSSAASATSQAKVTANKKKAKETAAAPPAKSSSGVHPKLERFQNQHLSNKQRNAMKRMEKEKPPTPQPTPAPVAEPSTPADPDVPADVGSLQI